MGRIRFHCEIRFRRWAQTITRLSAPRVSLSGQVYSPAVLVWGMARLALF